MKKFFIKNRHGKNISVILEKSDKQKGLVFIMPGLGQTKEAVHIQNFAASFSEKDFTVVSFDVTNGIGESEGDYSKASFTGYYNDLCDVINWAKAQEWYKKPFCLMGHSMGGVSVLHYGANHPGELSGIAPISTVISGYQSIVRFGKDNLIKASKKNKDGSEIIKEIDWEPFKEDILKYDIVPEASKFVMPVLMMVGEKDPGTPLEDQMKLYDGMPQYKEIHVIKGALHTFEEPEHLEEIKQIFHNWIDKRLHK